MIKKNVRDKAKQEAQQYLEKMTIQEQSLLLRYDSPAFPQLGIPEYNWWNEALHGVARAGTATVFPVAIAMAASFDKQLVKEVAEVISTEGRAKYNSYSAEGDTDIYKGLTFWSPNINIFRDPRWGRGHETFGEDPTLTACMGDIFIKGLQGDDDYFLKTAACVKHYAVHSGPEKLRHQFDAKIQPKDLWETYLPAFEYCVTQSKTEGVMGGYNSVNGEPACGSKTMIEEILRKDWGFEGYFVSDCWAIRDFHEKHKVTSSPEESAALAINSGCDLNCGDCYQQIMKAYYKGLITTKQIHTAALRVLTTRILLGMGKKTKWDYLDYKDVDTPESEKLNYKAATESIVLLKNNGILPIKLQKTKIIGVIGPNADSTVVLQGNYHGTASHMVTVMEGLKEAVKENKLSLRILYSQGSEITDDRTERLARKKDRISEAIITAKASDVVILCVGLDERYEGEEHHISTGDLVGGDKNDLNFPLVQQELIQKVTEQGKPVILCCMSGSCIDLSVYADKVAAILQVWYPGAQGGRALADILLGIHSPSGKLPITFYGADYNIPDFTDYSLRNRTYRYVEQGVLYPFGYGLTYGKTVLQTAAYTKEGKITYTITNESDVAVREVIQVYGKNVSSVFEVRNFVLYGFDSVYLLPSETKKGIIDLCQWSFTVVNDKGRRVMDGRNYRLWIGTHAPDERSCILMGNKCIELDVSDLLP